jgi:hypothetical protein
MKKNGKAYDPRIALKTLAKGMTEKPYSPEWKAAICVRYAVLLGRYLSDVLVEAREIDPTPVMCLDEDGRAYTTSRAGVKKVWESDLAGKTEPVTAAAFLADLGRTDWPAGSVVILVIFPDSTYAWNVLVPEEVGARP